MPVAHALGALLCEQGHLGRAEEVFRKDLLRWPNNLWALRGLQKCLLAQQQQAQMAESCAHETKDLDSELKVISVRLECSVLRADFKIEDSCLCAGLPVLRSS